MLAPHRHREGWSAPPLGCWPAFPVSVWCEHPTMARPWATQSVSPTPTGPTGPRALSRPHTSRPVGRGPARASVARATLTYAPRSSSSAVGSANTTPTSPATEPGGVVGFTTADEGEGESVGSVSDRDRGHQRFHPFADPGSVAGEVGVVLAEPTAELDDRGA